MYIMQIEKRRNNLFTARPRYEFYRFPMILNAELHLQRKCSRKLQLLHTFFKLLYRKCVKSKCMIRNDFYTSFIEIFNEFTLIGFWDPKKPN